MDLFSILVFFVILSILVLVHEFGHFIVAKRQGVLVEEFGLGLPPKIFGVKIGETTYSLNFLPFGGFVRVLGESYDDAKKIPAKLKKRSFIFKSNFQKIIILIAGVSANFLLGWLIISYLFTSGIPVPSKNVVIQKVFTASPADAALLKEGDLILTISHKGKIHNLENTSILVDLTKKFAGDEIILRVKRDSTYLNLTVVPRTHPPKGEGPLGIIISSIVFKKYPWYKAPFAGLVESLNITATILREILRTLFIFLTGQKVAVDVAGPIGIAKITSQAASYGVTAVLQLLSILSLNLAVLNILPFPALDGGRLAIVLFEATTKKKVHPEFEKRLNMMGFAILLSLIFLITIHDINRFLLDDIKKFLLR